MVTSGNSMRLADSVSTGYTFSAANVERAYEVLRSRQLQGGGGDIGSDSVRSSYISVFADSPSIFADSAVTEVKKINEIKKKMIEFYTAKFSSVDFDDITQNLVLLKHWFSIFMKSKKSEKRKEIEKIKQLTKDYRKLYANYKKATNRKSKEECRIEILKLLDITTRLPGNSVIREANKRIELLKKNIADIENEILNIANFYETIESLRKNTLIERFGCVKEDEFGFYFITKELALTYNNTTFRNVTGQLGKFLIRLSCFEGKRGIKIINLTKKHYDKGLEHFCISENICWGENSEFIEQVLDSGNLNTLVLSIISFLETPAYKNPYMNPIEKWFAESQSITYEKISDIVKITRQVKEDICTFFKGGKTTNVERLVENRQLIGQTITPSGEMFREITVYGYRVRLQETQNYVDDALCDLFELLFSNDIARVMHPYLFDDAEHRRLVMYLVDAIDVFSTQVYRWFPNIQYAYVFDRLKHAFIDWITRDYSYICFGTRTVSISESLNSALRHYSSGLLLSIFSISFDEMSRNFMHRIRYERRIVTRPSIDFAHEYTHTYGGITTIS